ncbi:MAG: TrkH family potassium uptake protein [Pseudomonadota bacterium]|nr:potassium transporter [Porticoccaceae bacterium]MEC7389729.1 TrkH family potassium uptake protein [Pseudomonadota bacterium]MDP7404552.1 TrkH family potassium uptake protein [Porticoccaceae bacterium]MEC7456051.1 TrkH family potassium uptake protein [Pseudomonadota bacterium]MEC7620660.1 TrkH family potassium uptake protein [Pseudomonadota bacterium]
MHLAFVSRVLGLMLMVFSTSMLVPIIFATIYQENTLPMFFLAFTITMIVGFLSWLPARNMKGEIRIRDGFIITVLFWLVLSTFGALPFALSQETNLSFIDALFESISGLTTTGATVFTNLEDLPKSILYYRQQLQWLGGIGIVVIAVSILPMIGVGGMQIYKAETPGPIKDTKLTPRIAETANALFKIYVFLTVVCAIAYWVAGMSWFDALSHSFSTISIGGFSTYDESLGHFDNNAVLTIASIFMVVSGLNFALHYTAWHARSIKSYISDPEARLFVLVILFGILVTTYFLYTTASMPNEEILFVGVFQLISILTTTGFTTTEFHLWPSFLPFFLILLSFFGACAGSTGGGIKMGRILIMSQQVVREIYRLIHPNAVLPIKTKKHKIPERVTDGIWAFFGIYFFIFYVMVLLLLANNLDYITAWSATAASFNNLGPGLGAVAENYADLNAMSKAILCSGMLLGRLEVFTLLVLLSPTFWRN